MKKFSLIKYLDPYDSYNDLSALDDENAKKIDAMKNSEVYKNISKKMLVMISNLQEIESAIQRGDVSAIYSLEDKDLHDIKRIIKRLRKRYMGLLNLTSEVKAKKHKKNCKK